MLALQLSYLGYGEISVHVGFEQCAGNGGGTPSFANVNLLGVARGRMPSTWVTTVPVRDDWINCRLVIWGEPALDDPIRGELIAEVSGQLPVLTISSRASVTHAEMPVMAGGAVNGAATNGAMPSITLTEIEH